MFLLSLVIKTGNNRSPLIVVLASFELNVILDMSAVLEQCVIING